MTAFFRSALDTNAISELMRPAPSPVVVAWFARHDFQDMCLTAVSEAELRFGVQSKPAGKRRDQLQTLMENWLDKGDLHDRILPFDSDAAKAYANIAFKCRKQGRPISTADCQIAAICLSKNLTLVTRNCQHFVNTGIDVVNPWTAGLH